MADQKNKTSFITIGLVDDHRLMRETYSNILKAVLLNGKARFKITVEANNGKDLIQKLQKSEIPEIIILDINMPEMDGFETINWLKKKYPLIKVIVITMHSRISFTIKMLLNGASAYLTKNSRKEDILSAIESVYSGGIYFDPETYGQLLNVLAINQKKSEQRADLTEREKEVLSLMTTELTYQEIAEKMTISLRTVEGYREKLFEKLKIKSRVGLAIYALTSGIEGEKD